MPKVSIIVPMYNVEKYIERCLNSLINQTLQDIEIIVVNDGSKDKSKQIIQKYLSKIKYYEKENGGLSSARNYGMKFATGEYIAFLDSDDYAEKNTYEEMYNLAKKEKADMVECDFVWEWEKNKYKQKLDKRRNYKNKREMMKRPRVVAWNKLIKRNIIEENNIKFPEGLIYEDLEFFYKIMPYIEKTAYINKCFIHYIQRENSISNIQTEKNADIFKIIDNIFEYYKDNNLYQKYEQELKYMCKRILLGSSMKRTLKIKDVHLRRKMFLKTIVHLVKCARKGQVPISTICFGITKLGIGGAERVLVDIVNELVKEYSITIFTIYGGGELEKELDKNIKVVSMYQKEKKNKLIPIYILICGKHIYNKYLKGKHDTEIAFLEGPITRIFSHKGNKKKIAWVHNDIGKVFGNSIKAKIKNFIDKYFYKKYDEIIFVSEQNKQSFEKIYGNISKRKVIYNYINKNRILKMSMKSEITKEKNFPIPNTKKTILTIARLVKQKGIDRFIQVHKKLIDEGFFHTVYVIGDGEEKDKLQQLTKKLNVQDSFIFLGKKENPYLYIKQADYFALLSYYEGYGMVLEEAKILNKPIIITNTAATEAVENYKHKLVIENSEEDIYIQLKNVLTGKYDYLNSAVEIKEYDNKYLLNEVKHIL